MDGDRSAGHGSSRTGISGDELATPAPAGAAPASRERRRGARRQTVAGRAGVSLSSPGDEPAQSDASAAGGVALLQRPG